MYVIRESFSIEIIPNVIRTEYLRCLNVGKPGKNMSNKTPGKRPFLRCSLGTAISSLDNGTSKA